ncbi:MAG: type II secretion system protein [Candidatus Daviesbacteria bacterium]|nr:type II secretion system protein [Candidatus Daviesbacteria bacterium]
MKQRGFTLVEILVVTAVTSVILIFLTQIFFSSLRGGNKAQALAIIKQNGQSVLDTLDKNIRNSDNIVCPAIPTGATSATSNTLVIVKNGIFTRYRFKNASNGSIGELDQDTPVQDLQDPNQQNINNFINLNLCNESDPLQAPTVNAVTDNGPSSVSVSNGVFIRNKPKGFKDVVTIDFDLSPAGDLNLKTFGQLSPVPFKTTVELR